jgi:large subunit ribosomal protein L15
MNLHSLKNTEGARKKRKRVGRGMASGHGKTSTRGHKGQMARKGANHKEGFEGGQMRLIRRIPKRGFTNPTRVEYQGVNVFALACFEDGTAVTVKTLFAAGIVRNAADRVKILGSGDLSRKLTVKAHAFSKTAREKIEAAGGMCEAEGN